MTASVFSIDTSRFSSISFSDSGRNHTPEYYANLNLTSDERLLFQVMANPNLTTGLFDTGKVLMYKDEFVGTAHVIVSGEVDILHPEGNYVVGPGAVIGLTSQRGSEKKNVGSSDADRGGAAAVLVRGLHPPH